MAVCVMPLVVKLVGAPGALGSVLAVADAALDSPLELTARTCNVYCVLALKPLNV